MILDIIGCIAWYQLMDKLVSYGYTITVHSWSWSWKWDVIKTLQILIILTTWAIGWGWVACGWMVTRIIIAIINTIKGKK